MCGVTTNRCGAKVREDSSTEKPQHRFYRSEPAARQTQQNEKASALGAWLVKLGDVNKTVTISH